MARAREDFASFVRARWAELTDELVEDGLTREQAQQAAVRGLADCQPGWRRVLAEDNPEVVVRDAIASYRPNRPRPRNLEGLRKNLRRGEDGRWRWHWDPAFLSGKSRDGRSDVDTLGDAARNLTVPTLLVRGRMSDMLSLQGVTTFREQCPHAHFVDIAEAGHMVVGDRNDAFTTAVIDFVDQLGEDDRDEEVAS